MIVIKINQLAEQLGVHRNTVRNWIKSGKLPCRSMSGKRYLVSENDFARLCREFQIDRSLLKLKRVSNGTSSEEADALGAGESVRQVGEKSQRLAPQGADVCLTCGSCAGVCPISGIDGIDPRKAVRMVNLGMEEELIHSQWPWKCTLCGKCEEACPMSIELADLFLRVRGLRERDRTPGSLQMGVRMRLEKGNNLGIPKEDFVRLLGDVAQEMRDEGFTGFSAPIDVQGASILVTINSKEPFIEPERMKLWWKIFHAAEESWTIPSENWDGVNWGFFTGDEESWKAIVGGLVENMRRLQCKTLLLPE